MEEAVAIGTSLAGSGISIERSAQSMDEVFGDQSRNSLPDGHGQATWVISRAHTRLILTSMLPRVALE